MENVKEAVFKNPFYFIKAGLLCVFIFGVVMILYQKMADAKNERSNVVAMQIAGLWESESNPVTESTEPTDQNILEEEEELLPEEAAALADIRLDVLKKINEDVTGWIEIPGTVVSYPLMKGEDNQYYLSHDWQKEESKAGAIFMESQCSPDLAGHYTIIYGHRMRNEAMFGSLKHYEDAEYWREHPSVYLVIDSGIYRYDIFSAWEAGVTDMVYYLDLTDREEEFIELCLENSVIATGLVPDRQDKILTLSTCTGSGHSKRWTIQGYLAQVYTPHPSGKGTYIDGNKQGF